MSGFQPERGSEEWDRQHASIERGNEAWEELHGAGSSSDRAWYAKKRFIIPVGLCCLFSFCVANAPRTAGTTGEADWNQSVSSAGLDTADQAMSFEECNRRIRSMADAVGTAPSNIVDSNAMRIVRFSGSDGSVLVTCDAADEKMIVVKSPAG